MTLESGTGRDSKTSFVAEIGVVGSGGGEGKESSKAKFSGGRDAKF